MTMKILYRKFLGKIDRKGMMKRTAELTALELKQTFPCYHASAAHTVELLKAAGISKVEKLTFAADGKTAYQDKITPLAWDATCGKVTVIKAPGMLRGDVIADYEEHPFELVKGSVATAPGGEVMRIVSDTAALAGADVHDALIMSPLGGDLGYKYLSTFLDLGARGIVTDASHCTAPADNGVMWNTAFSEKGTWHITAEDRPFTAFSISPERGRKLRAALAAGEVIVRVECDGRRYVDKVDLVTALVPGRRKEEFWIFAHLYEPLSNDNSSGVSAAIETAKQIIADGTPEFSLRLVFGLEHYGFAAYADKRGKNLSAEVIGAIDYDAMYLRPEWSLNFRCAAAGTPFFGNYLVRRCCEELAQETETPKFVFVNSHTGLYDDDAFLTDSTTGVPTVWPIRVGKNLWHNSLQTIDYIDENAYAVGTAIHTAFVSSVLNPQKEMIFDAALSGCQELREELNRIVGGAKEHLTRRYEILVQDMKNFQRIFSEKEIAPALAALKTEYETLVSTLDDSALPRSPWRDYAAQIVPTRLTTGFPFDQAKIPFAERHALPDMVLYGHFGAILSNMDGKRNLAELFRMAEHECGVLMDEAKVKSELRGIFHLAKYGYLSFGNFKGITKEEIIASLRKAGVAEGDFLLVHSSLTAFGVIEGWTQTVVDAFREAVGEKGTVLFPLFVYPFVYIGGPNGSRLHRPYDREMTHVTFSGKLPGYVFKHCPDAVRSAHITHSWVGFGPLAKEACSAQGAYDAPVGDNSPCAFARKHHGKIVHFGNAVTSTTFLHHIEDHLHLPGVEDTFCTVALGNGLTRGVLIPNNLPGDRDFYHGTVETIKFFKAACAKGLKINTAALGLGTITMMEAEELFRIGCELAEKDPFIFLCDSEECLSCRHLKEKYNK